MKLHALKLAIDFQQCVTRDKEKLHKIVGAFHSFYIKASKQYATWMLLVLVILT